MAFLASRSKLTWSNRHTQHVSCACLSSPYLLFGEYLAHAVVLARLHFILNAVSLDRREFAG